MLTTKACVQSWVDKGERSLGDLFDAEGQMYSIEYTQTILELKCDFLLYNKLKKKIQMIIGNNHISIYDNKCLKFQILRNFL